MPTAKNTSQHDQSRRRSIEKWILHRIFHKLLQSDDFEIVLEDSASKRGDNTITLKLPSLYRTIKILLKPDIMLGQAYVEGHWSVEPDKLYDFLYIIRSQDTSKLNKWFLVSNRFHLLRDTFKQRFFPIRSTRAVIEHYNTDPIFMSCILGPSLSYTCAFFDNTEFSLDRAQERKLETIAKRISLTTGHTVLDVGSGWGYAAFPLAEKYACNVTGITISEAQVEFCNTRKSASPARDKLQFINVDYTKYEPSFKFHRVISVGMLEHVGRYQYKFFFDKVAEFMRDDGIALVHSMVQEHAISPDAWIDRNIFPGGYIPTISEVIFGIEQSNCQIIKIFTHQKFHYFNTLNCWKDNLFANRAKCESALEDQGLKRADVQAIIRIWEYFLSSSKIAFSNRHGHCRVAHFILSKKR
jgi:cyclopropane-fatty-acyl-phospholipid synthase